MLSRSTIWQIMWYTCAALALVVGTGICYLGAPALGGLFLVLGLALLPFIGWSTRRHRRAAARTAGLIRIMVGGQAARAMHPERAPAA